MMDRFMDFILPPMLFQFNSSRPDFSTRAQPLIRSSIFPIWGIVPPPCPIGNGVIDLQPCYPILPFFSKASAERVPTPSRHYRVRLVP
jgi:hypothetical protein